MEENLTPIDEEEVFSQMIGECYSETTNVGILELDTVTVMKDQDPITFGFTMLSSTSKKIYQKTRLRPLFFLVCFPISLI
jgi:hypothetical protein